MSKTTFSSDILGFDIGVLGSTPAAPPSVCIADEHREKSRSFLDIR